MWCFLILCLCLSNEIWCNDTELSMVQIIFRHGQRQTENLYPTDPNINSTFYPDGIGGLTNFGKMQAFKLGQSLREKYNDFLGGVYTESLMSIKSTAYARTRMSALLLLAGLWPPTKLQTWNEHLPWIPIPVDYKKNEDGILNVAKCAKRNKVLNDQISDPEVQKLYIQPYEKFMKFLEEKTKSEIKSPRKLIDFYFIFKTEIDQNLPVPEWVHDIYPEPMYTAAANCYSFYNHNPEIKKINSGYLINRILEEFDKKMNGTNKEKKLSLYSGHDVTLGHFLNVFKPEDKHIPDYASAVIIELYRNKTTNKYFVKMLYRRNETQVDEISLSNCQLCSIEQFREFVKDIIPQIPYEEACKL